jgi:hypothetical protein
MVDDLEGLTLPPGRAESFGVRAPFCGVAVRNLAKVQVGEVVILGAPFDWGASIAPVPASDRGPSGRPTTCRRTAAGPT